ncbi:hypothetical protein MKW92_002550 [Papaver armeniacum]|nr:hypothetical protein MKW92_002550 [Papaver armeniacum]
MMVETSEIDDEKIMQNLQTEDFIGRVTTSACSSFAFLMSRVVWVLINSAPTCEFPFTLYSFNLCL